MKWPNKKEREDFEINGFINAYAQLQKDSRRFKIINSKRENPDYIVKDINTEEEFGVEVTSVYLNDRSVPDVHMRDHEDILEIPENMVELNEYLERIINKIKDKVCKARKGYNTIRPLILSIYLNEYISIYLGKSELEEFVHKYEEVFDTIAPFKEIVFWSLGNGAVFIVRPS